MRFMGMVKAAFEAEDFGAEFAPELRLQEERIREREEANK